MSMACANKSCPAFGQLISRMTTDGSCRHCGVALSLLNPGVNNNNIVGEFGNVEKNMPRTDVSTIDFSYTFSEDQFFRNDFNQEKTDKIILFGRYEVPPGQDQKKGGMGSVIIVRDLKLNRLVALKRPLNKYCKDVWKRFKNEAMAAAQLNHPNLCPIFDIGEHDGQIYLTMPYFDGGTLAERLKKKGEAKQIPAMYDAVLWVVTLAQAMEAAHRKKIVHRDLKPSNIMFDNEGRLIIMDFGLARLLEDEGTRLTNAGDRLGTPGFMSPEQANGDREAIGPATDIFALGVILYLLLTGKTPFPSNSFHTFLYKLLNEEPTPPHFLRPDLDQQLGSICLKAMAKLIDDRFRTMAEFADALSLFLQDSDPIRKPIPAVQTVVDRPVHRPARQAPELRLIDTPSVAMDEQHRWTEHLQKDSPSWTNDRGMTFRLIPPGKYMMGASRNDHQAKIDEQPRRKVTIDRPFWASQFPLDHRFLRDFLDEAPSDHDDKIQRLANDTGFARTSRDSEVADDAPAVEISWTDAALILGWLSRLDGNKYRFPTESEWEYLARAGSTGVFWWGNDDAIDDVKRLAVFATNAPSGPESARANAWGLIDVLGNVSEWTGSYYEPRLSETCQKLAEVRSVLPRVIRSGSWRDHSPEELRLSRRQSLSVGVRIRSLGVRIVCEVS